MTAFTRNWTDAYMGVPAQTEDARLGATRIRETRRDLFERMAVDHSWAGNDRDGAHRRATLLPQTSDPSTDAGAGILYSKDASGAISLFYKDSKGNVTQLTGATGGLEKFVVTGTIIAVGNATDADGVSYLQCNGQAVSRVTYSGLFFAIGILWGVGDGVTTFNVPNLGGRALIGRGNGGYTGATTRNTGQVLGSETHTIDITQIPGHSHNLEIHNSSIAASAGNVALQATSSSDGFNTNMIYTSGGNLFGVSQPHNNMQPSAVVNWWIKT